MALMTIEEARPAPAPGHGAPLFALGFRPFYLLAAAFGALAVPLWIAAQAGVRLPVRIDMLWHMHEMVFGFALAVVVGFLYTAGYNWTKLWTPRGKALAAIAAVWVAGRIAMLAAPPRAHLMRVKCGGAPRVKKRPRVSAACKAAPRALRLSFAMRRNAGLRIDAVDEHQFPPRLISLTCGHFA